MLTGTSAADPECPDHSGASGGGPNIGHFDGEWCVEENPRRSKLGIRVSEQVHDEHSEYQRIRVYRSEFFGHVLTLDDLFMLTEHDEFVYHEMLVHVPLLSIESPRSALIIGGGDAGCVREALKHPTLERIVQCDIDERVTRVAEKYFDWVTPALSDPRVEVLFDDGIEYVAAHENVFDLVIVDSTDPIGAAVGLFGRDFYRQVAKALRPGGVMAAQSESPHFDPDLVGQIYGEIRSVYTHVDAYLGAIPTYPSGLWSFAYASETRRHGDYFDLERARAIEASCKYYNRAMHSAAFALPNFVRTAIAAADASK